MDERERLLEKLRRIEALYAGAATEGEREAAGGARERIAARLRLCEQADPPIEYRFSLHDPWSRQLFTALLRRYGIRPYRYPRQRRNSVMARVSRTFVEQTLWPEFSAINAELQAHLGRICADIIKQAVAEDTSEAEEVPGGGEIGGPDGAAGEE